MYLYNPYQMNIISILDTDTLKSKESDDADPRQTHFKIAIIDKNLNLNIEKDHHYKKSLLNLYIINCRFII